MPACLCYPCPLLLSAAAVAHRNLKDVREPRSGNWIVQPLRRPREVRLLLVADEALQLPRVLPQDVVDVLVEVERTLLLCRLCLGSRMNHNTESKPANPISAAWPRAYGTFPIS